MAEASNKSSIPDEAAHHAALNSYSRAVVLYEWLLAEARWWAEMQSSVRLGNAPESLPYILPWETPEAEGITAEDMT